MILFENKAKETTMVIYFSINYQRLSRLIHKEEQERVKINDCNIFYND